MRSLWFKGISVPAQRHGDLLYAVSPGETWAVLHVELTFVDDPEQEAAELVGLSGALVAGIGGLLIQMGAKLPDDLYAWSEERTVPASELGGWTPNLVMIGGDLRLAQSRAFEHLNVFVSTTDGRYLVVLAPKRAGVPRLEDRPDLPPRVTRFS